MHATLPRLMNSDFPAIRRGKLDTLQVNLGYRCNQSCLHCHVNAGPKRKEVMSRDNIDVVLQFLIENKIAKLDLTGGAPELNPDFRYLVEQARKHNVHVIDRCNLSILFEDGQQHLAAFLANHQVEVVASLPCYQKENVDAQRGNGVYLKSMLAMRLLNEHGYGKPGSGLILNLMYNPGGAYLPPAQQQLEADYKRELHSRFGIEFNHLYTLTNMPIQRFGSTLISKGEFEDYMALLKQSFSPANLETVMCRNLVSIDWQGFVYDCDFNQMLDLPLQQGQKKIHISQLQVNAMQDHPVVIADHCYGCTAGQGSSCGGALS